MDWLFDLIFGNFWILILLFWLFRSLGRGKAEEQAKRRRQRQYPPLTPTTMPDGWDMEPSPMRQQVKITNPKPVMAEEVVPEPVVEKNVRSRGERIVKQQDNTRQAPISRPVASPAEGMMWSQVFGPPRSKLSHHAERKNRR